MSNRDVVTRYGHGLLMLTVLGFYLLHSVNAAACGHYRYGPNCAVECNCLYDKYCQSNGQCGDYRCQDEWSGPTCQRRNIGRGKPAWLSSTLNSYWGAEKAVDGESSGYDYQCAHTDYGDQAPRLRVDLKQQQPVYAMLFRNRHSCCKDRMNNFEVYVTNSTGYLHLELCYRREESVVRLDWVYFTCTQPMYARYVWILSTHSHLTICEMEIYACSDYTFGTDCDAYCNCLNTSEVCHKVTGACETGCPKGYHGSNCTEDCVRGTFGENCKFTCHCKRVASCDRFEGSCGGTGCADGWYDTVGCQEECRPGNVGYNCTQQCHCFTESDICNRTTGECASGCGLGYTGIRCQEECMPGTYGRNCTQACHCKNATEACDRMNGKCRQTGCPVGYVGIDCKMPCRNGTFGDKCLMSCHCLGDDDICNKTSGLCSSGCAVGYEGETCQTVGEVSSGDETGDETAGMSSAVIGGIVGGVLAAILVTVIVVTAVIFLRRRKRGLRNQSTNTLVTAHATNGRNSRVPNDYNDDSLVVTIPTTTQVHTKMADTELRTKANTNISKSEDMVYMNSMEVAKATAIKVEDFPDYVQKRLEDGKLLEGEFKRLPEPLKKGFDVAIKPENLKKNRYQKIFPYDSNRVVLDTVKDDPFSDYINASYINGYGKNKEFIAAQVQEKTISEIYYWNDGSGYRSNHSSGPVATMIADFWRMIWTVKCGTIVMLTNIMESGKKKCELYWELDSVLDAEEIKVEHALTEEYADFCIRTFKLTKENGESRVVKQFHFTSWPDHDAPDDTTAMLEFLNKIRSIPAGSDGPTIVHCSAGVGRTGTFICLNYLINQAAAEGQIDMEQCTHTMRSQRMHLIQTKAQFAFLHRAVCDAITLQIWPIQATDFMAWYSAEQNNSSNAGIYNNDENDIATKFKDEYKLLTNAARFQKTRENSQQKNKKNSSKNMNTDSLAADDYRVFLSTAQTDYVESAVGLSSYVKRNAYIATGLPTNAAVVDFWRLVYEKRCRTLVVLCDEHEITSRVQNFSQYWTEKEKNVFGPFNVHKTSQNNSGPCIIREFSFTYDNMPSLIPETVKQFSLLGWPANKNTPSSPKDILSLFEIVDDWQRQTSNGPIVVQCMDGTFKSGLYCASSIIIERLREDQTVSVLSTVKQLKAIRPRFINSIEQYQFCYDVAKVYLDSFSDYYNFK